MRNILVILVALFMSSCGENAPSTSKEATKIADIYFRFAVEHVAGSGAKYRNLMTPKVLAAGKRCVQDKIVSKKLGIYGRSKLQSLLLKHLFPNDLDSYKTFLSQRAVHDSLESRVQKLGFKSVVDATRSTNLIAKSLVNEYAFYSRFNDVHKTMNGVNTENLVIKNCAPAVLKEHLPG